MAPPKEPNCLGTPALSNLCYQVRSSGHSDVFCNCRSGCPWSSFIQSLATHTTAETWPSLGSGLVPHACSQWEKGSSQGPEKRERACAQGLGWSLGADAVPKVSRLSAHPPIFMVKASLPELCPVIMQMYMGLVLKGVERNVICHIEPWFSC